MQSYFAYGANIVAVADGVVVHSVDQFPDNIPKTEAGFEPALPAGCHHYQGYYFSRPVPIERFEQLVQGGTIPD